jgi:hypothetical protein
MQNLEKENAQDAESGISNEGFANHSTIETG